MNADVLAAIEAERAVVRAGVATEAQDDVLSPTQWGALLLRHAGLAMPHAAHDEADEARFERQMVRVAWVAVAALEAAHRRRERAKVAGPSGEQRASWKGW
jgi:hypothetical protein